MDLTSLQNLIKRDPAGYTQEFQQQYRHFQSSLQVFKLQGNIAAKRNLKDFANLITFLSHVAPCFRTTTESKAFPNELLDVLQNHSGSLDTVLRTAIVQALILLQNRELISRFELLPTFFKLFRLPDKTLRELLFSHIVNDIRRINKKQRNDKLNKSLQNFMFTMFKDENRMAAKKSLDVVIDLWRRKIWMGDKIVNAVMTACFSPDTKIKVTALRFFLGVDMIDEDEDDEKSSAAIVKQLNSEMSRALRKKKRERALKRAALKLKKGKENAHSSVNYQSVAISLVYDPQQSAERLFSMLKASAAAFEVRLLIMNVISRLVGTHKLVLENYYPFLQKYIQPHQKQVTQVLTFLAQASHDLVSPDVLIPCIKTLANQFVTDRSSPEIMAVGLNAIREVCARAPLVMDGDLLSDLIQYKKNRNKGVMMAARSLIALYRDVNPTLLIKKERGKLASEALAAGELKLPEFGTEKFFKDVDGVELLLEKENEEEANEVFEENSDGEEAETLFLKGDEFDNIFLQLDNEGDDEDSETKESKEDKKKEDKSNESDKAGEKLGKAEEEKDETKEGEKEKTEESKEKSDDKTDQKEKGSEPLQTESTDKKEETPSLPVGATRILTEEDFEKIKRIRRRQALGENATAKTKQKKKRHREDGSTLLAKTRQVETGDSVSIESITGPQKKDRRSRGEKLSSVMEGREGRGKFGAPKTKGGGSTNKQKLKRKPFALAKHSIKVRSKQTATMNEKREKRGEHIKTLKRQSENKRKSKRRKV